jgi:hypothetical protein
LIRDTTEPSRRVEGNRPAAAPNSRAMLAVGGALALLASACDRADAASLYPYWSPHAYRSADEFRSTYGSRSRPALVAPKHRHGSASERAPVPAPVPAPKGPLQIVISIDDQRISVYSGDVLVARSAVSTGVPGHPTPTGVFSVIQKQKWHRSNLYSDAPMPYMQRITWSGVALHAGILPGHPASHGCIRVSEDFAVRMWQLTKLGNRVIIARSDVAPVEISHPQLFGQKPKADISASLAVPIEAAQATPMPASEFIKPVKGIGMAADPAERSDAALPEHRATADGSSQGRPQAAPAKIEPISVFISRKQGKLFVRQGYMPLFESAVTIRDPGRPFGTHVFTAIERKENSGALRWTVVSFPEEAAGKIESIRFEPTSGRHRERDTKRAKLPVPPRASAERASAALERIEIPQDAADRIAELLSPKSSLIISDQALSEETDSDTDFIVLVR